MEERKFIKLKKEEFGIKEYIKRDLGKGKISRLDIEYTPVGEKIIVSTSKPGLVIGRKGEKIQELTEVLKRRFKLENPHIEISEIENPLFDAQNVADEIALALERMGNLKFKVIAYRKLQEIINAGALGCELRLTGKLPSERARSWRFAEGYLKKAGDSSKEVDRAQATGLTKTGIIGVKVAIMPPDAKIYDKIDINDGMRALIKGGGVEKVEEVSGGENPKKKGRKKKVDKKAEDIAVEAGKVAKMEEDKVKDSTTPKSKDENTNNPKQDKESKSDSEDVEPNASKSSEEVQKLEDTKIEGEEEVLKESPDIKPKEDRTAIAVEQEIEEGVSEEGDKAIEEEEKSEKVEKISNLKQNDSERSDGESKSSSIEDTDKNNRKDIKEEKLSREEGK